MSAPRGEGRCPSWWGSLDILPQISIFRHYLTPKKREHSPQAKSSQQKLDWKKNIANLLAGQSL